MTFKIDEMMKLTNVNPRAEKHGEEDVTTVDLSMNAIFNADEIEPLLHGHKTVDMDAFKKTFWDADGKPLIFMKTPLTLTAELEKQVVKITKPGVFILLESKAATVKAFKIGFNHGTTIELALLIQTNTDGDTIGHLCEYINHDVQVIVEQAQQELPLE